MIELGLASSHAPAMFRPKEVWEAIFAFRTPDVAQPKEAELETPEVIQGYIDRIEHGFEVRRAQLEQDRLGSIKLEGKVG